MLSTINPSTSIRPLGEEHLRMFRRMTQGGGAVPKVSMPKDALGPTLIPIGGRYKIENAKDIVRAYGIRLPTLSEVISAIQDQSQRKVLGKARFWTSDEGVKLNGFCKINYADGTISEEVTVGEWDKLSEKLKAYVWGGYWPLTFGIDCDGARLDIDGKRYYEDVAQIAFVRND